MTPIVFVPLLTLVLVAALFHFLPRFSRPGLFFGITVPPGFPDTGEARRILRRYRIVVWACSLAALALAAVSVLRNGGAWLAFAMALLAGGAIAGFAAGRRRTKPCAMAPPRVRTAELIAPRQSPLNWLPTALVPFGFLAASAWYLRAHWQEIPARFSIHYKVHGVPNGWAERTWRDVYGPLIIGAAPLLILLLIALVMACGIREASGSRSARFRAATLRLMIALMYAMGALFAALPISLTGLGFHVPVWLLVLLPAAAVVAFGRPLLRISQEPEETSRPLPDECWKWGFFYYNPDDPALLVEKRFGVGYSFNFGNKWAWVLAAAIVAIPAAGMLIVFA